MASGTKNQHVLIVDDDPIICEVLKAFFQGHGFDKISVADNGIKAGAIFDAYGEQIGLITCDLNMPEADGIEFFQMLRGSKTDVPVVILSSALDTIVESAELLAKVYGVNLIGTLKKPLDQNQLEAVLGPYFKS